MSNSYLIITCFFPRPNKITSKISRFKFLNYTENKFYPNRHLHLCLNFYYADLRITLKIRIEKNEIPPALALACLFQRDFYFPFLMTNFSLSIIYTFRKFLFLKNVILKEFSLKIRRKFFVLIFCNDPLPKMH